MRMANARWLIVLLVAAVLGACGGGGGGDGPPAAADIPVSLTNFRATPVRAEVFEGEQVGRLDIQADVEGDLAYLNGKTIYVVIEDPARLFSETPMVMLSPDGKNNRVTLFERATTAPGRFTGNLRVFVCLDAACQTQMRNSPQSIPYDVTVLRGLAVAQSEATLSARFGEPATALTLPITLPDNVRDWQIRVDRAPGPIELFTASIEAAKSTAPPGAVLSARRASTGNYQANLWITAEAQDSQGRVRHMTRTVRVNYAVSANPSLPNAIFEPAALNVVSRRFQPIVDVPPVHILSQGPIKLDSVARDSTGNPATDALLAFQRWVLLPIDPSSTAVGFSPCTMVPASPTSPPGTLFETQCLPVGTYTARVRYLVGAPGVQTEALFPVSMEVRQFD